MNLGQGSIIIAKSSGDKKGKVVIGGRQNNNIRVAGQINVSGKTINSPSIRLY